MTIDDKGRPLPPYTYYNASKGTYRLRLPSGKLRTIKGTDGHPAPYELAIQIAERVNAQRGSAVDSIGHWVNEYVAWAESMNPALLGKDSWKSRKSELNKYAKEFSHIDLAKLKLSDLRPWWDSLTYDQQHNRQSAFNKFYVYCISNEACKENPFTTADHLPHLIKKPKPAKARSPLELDQFFTIYAAADRYPHVKIAMAIALTTGLREADICRLKFKEHIVDNHLCTSIGKSVGQRGAHKAAHHGYDLSQHTLLGGAINLARELSLRHRRCPFILSYHQRGHAQLGDKEHISQVMPKKLSHDFATVRDTCELKWTKAKPAAFHETRGLWIQQAMQHYGAGEVQEAAAHLDVSTTKGYVADHKAEFKPIYVVITEKMLEHKL